MANFTIIDPRGMEFETWAKRMSEDLAGYVWMTSRPTEDAWQDWARQVAGATALDGTVSDPGGFSDWREWAASWAMTGN